MGARFNGANVAVQEVDAGSGGHVVVTLTLPPGGSVDFGAGAATNADGTVDTVVAAFDPQGTFMGSHQFANAFVTSTAHPSGDIIVVSNDPDFDIGTGPLIIGEGIAVARLTP